MRKAEVCIKASPPPASLAFIGQARVVQRLENAVHQINYYPITYSLDSDLDSVIQPLNNWGQVTKHTIVKRPIQALAGAIYQLLVNQLLLLIHNLASFCFVGLNLGEKSLEIRT